MAKRSHSNKIMGALILLNMTLVIFASSTSGYYITWNTVKSGNFAYMFVINDNAKKSGNAALDFDIDESTAKMEVYAEAKAGWFTSSRAIVDYHFDTTKPSNEAGYKANAHSTYRAYVKVHFESVSLDGTNKYIQIKVKMVYNSAGIVVASTGVKRVSADMNNKDMTFYVYTDSFTPTSTRILDIQVDVRYYAKAKPGQAMAVINAGGALQYVQLVEWGFQKLKLNGPL